MKHTDNAKLAVWTAIGAASGITIATIHGTTMSSLGLWVGVGAALGSAVYFITMKEKNASK